jgi:hypothetical protein
MARRRILGTTLLTNVGVAMLVLGGLLVTFVAVASASGPSITITPRSHLTAKSNVVVTGTGFAHRSSGVLLECNLAPGEPATVIAGDGTPQAIPIGCSDPVGVTTTRRGKVPPTTLKVQTGTLGSWETGDDSSGNPAAADSADFPCPPTQPESDLGVSCVFEFFDNKGQEAISTVSFRSSGPGTTIPGSTTTSPSTTLPGCDAVPVSATGGSASLTATPGTCLVSGTHVSLTGSGFTANSSGSILECNSSPDQPTVSTLGDSLPVSCSVPTSHLVTINGDGDLLPTNFTVVTGTVGPPATGTDSSGNSAAADAALYPCPPTTAQVTAGVTCDFAIGDTAGDSVIVPMSFEPS